MKKLVTEHLDKGFPANGDFLHFLNAEMHEQTRTLCLALFGNQNVILSGCELTSSGNIQTGTYCSLSPGYVLLNGSLYYYKDTANIPVTLNDRIVFEEIECADNAVYYSGENLPAYTTKSLKIVAQPFTNPDNFDRRIDMMPRWQHLQNNKLLNLTQGVGITVIEHLEMLTLNTVTVKFSATVDYNAIQNKGLYIDIRSTSKGAEYTPVCVGYIMSNQKVIPCEIHKYNGGEFTLRRNGEWMRYQSLFDALEMTSGQARIFFETTIPL